MVESTVLPKRRIWPCGDDGGITRGSLVLGGARVGPFDPRLRAGSLDAWILACRDRRYEAVWPRDSTELPCARQHAIHPRGGTFTWRSEFCTKVVAKSMELNMLQVRPEIRQYLVESDNDGRPFDRLHRTQVYQRAKNVDDTLAFGTRRDVYASHHEWACHSMWPTEVTDEEAKRAVVGTAEFGTTQPYSASVLNISAMSYGAISDNAILALNNGARMGNFYHNTGEGGVSRFHLEGGGDVVWNIGTGYFGCGSGSGSKRVFDPVCFQEMLAQGEGRIKMLEIKLSQGAKPGHGGLLPRAKITEEIARARKLKFPSTDDCHSPARHSAFGNPFELVEFIARLRELSDGLPVGIKLCVGAPAEIGALCKAMIATQQGPDFITVDGAEGGTGAAPPELTDSVGLPLEEGLVCVRNVLTGAGLRDKVKLTASGRITSGFSLVRTLALGADLTSAARAFMLSLGCIQALKCNTNKCPTGIATLNKDLMYGLDPEVKSQRGAYERTFSAVIARIVLTNRQCSISIARL